MKGKYGYVDDVGKVRVVEYGATKYGFEPSGEGITVPPPTLVDESTNKDGTLNDFQDPYYEQVPAAPSRAAPRPKTRPQPQPSYDTYSETQNFAPASQQNFGPAPPKPSFANAAAVQSNFDYVPQTKPQSSRGFAPAPLRPQGFSFNNPAPVDEQDNYAEPAPLNRPLPKITYAQPAPAPARAPPQFAGSFGPAQNQPQSFAPRPNPVARQSGSGGGVLDQLAKDYALPQGGAAPLHDISFGYY